MLQHPSNPIGIFDSGMGGLTVAKTLTDLMPNENIVYFGDTAHTPWGEKSASAIQAYSLKICEVLLQHHCKTIVIACHTASAVAHEFVREYVGSQAEVFNVIDPVVQHIHLHHANKKIGLIGTKQTVRSNIYQKRLDTLDQNIEFCALATPLLVPLIEEGFAEREVAELILREYLSHPNLNKIEALILGCTHYPLLKNYIEHFYQNALDIIDTSQMTASIVKAHLIREQLSNPQTVAGKKVFYVSDYSEFFENTAKVFFPGEIKLEPYPLWE